MGHVQAALIHLTWHGLTPANNVSVQYLWGTQRTFLKNQDWAVPEKQQTGGLGTYFSEKPWN